jgi:hypothetical protein
MDTTELTLTEGASEEPSKQAIASVSQDLGDFAYKVSELAAHLQVLGQRVAELETALEGCKSHASQLGEQNAQFQKGLAEAEGERAETAKRLAASEFSCAELEAGRGRLEKDLTVQLKATEEQQRQAGEWKACADGQRGRIAEFRKKITDLEKTARNAKSALEMRESARAQLAIQVDGLKDEVRDAQRQVLLKHGRSLAAVLSDLSVLAGEEPAPVEGLTARAVFEGMRTTLNAAWERRLRPFPSNQEAPNHVFWLDADNTGLDVLQKRYDWSPDRPFEGLEPGRRRLVFRLLRRGWAAGDDVLQPARVVPLVLADAPHAAEVPLAELTQCPPSALTSPKSAATSRSGTARR